MNAYLRLADLAEDGAAISIADAQPKAGDTMLGLLAKISQSLAELAGGVTRYLGYASFPFGGNEDGSLADLLEPSLDNWPRAREVAVLNDGDGAQTVAGETLSEGGVLSLTLSEAIAATYSITSTGGAHLKVFFIA